MLVAEVASQGGRTTTVVVVVLAKCGFEHEDGRAQDGRLTRHKAELLPLPALLQLLPPQPRAMGDPHCLVVYRAQRQLQPPMHSPASAEMRPAIVAVPV
jgi:hypothetical protein